MSVDYNKMVGAYAKVYNPLTEKESFIYACVNEKCVDKGKKCSSDFCPRCGKEISKKKVMIYERIEFDCEEALNDKMYRVMKDDEYYYYISNISADNDGFLEEDAFENEITPEQITSGLAKLNKNRSKEISKLKKVFGEENVKVKWGVLCWVS